MLKVSIVGNGGGLNVGLPYNAFMLNNHLLVETPPDVVLSLNRLGHSVQGIDAVFISHLHGDHTFGLPFLVITKWQASLQTSETAALTICGPDGVEEQANILMVQAFTDEHPCYAWFKQHVTFHVIPSPIPITWDGLAVSFFPVQHLIPTFGFLLEQQQTALLAYIADTVWCPQVETVLTRMPQTVLADMCGGQVHMSVQDMVTKAVPLTGPHTTYYGMHLSQEFYSPHPSILCAKPGDEILVQ